MRNPRKTHCKKGHKFTPKNEIWFVDINGKDQRKCRKCANAIRNKRCKLRYRNDEAYRERKRNYARKRYQCRLNHDQSQRQSSQDY